jgi:hypothetical protein
MEKKEKNPVHVQKVEATKGFEFYSFLLSHGPYSINHPDHSI